MTRTDSILPAAEIQFESSSFSCTSDGSLIHFADSAVSCMNPPNLHKFKSSRNVSHGVHFVVAQFGPLCNTHNVFSSSSQHGPLFIRPIHEEPERGLTIITRKNIPHFEFCYNVKTTMKETNFTPIVTPPPKSHGLPSSLIIFL